MRNKEALHLYLKSMNHSANSTQLTKIFAFWRLGHILHLSQFINLKHSSKSTVASQFALKPLYYAEPKIVVFYLP